MHTNVVLSLFFIRYSISNIDPRKQLPILSTVFQYFILSPCIDYLLLLHLCQQGVDPGRVAESGHGAHPATANIGNKQQSPDTVHTLQQQTLGTSSRVAESGHGAHPATTNIGNQFNYRSHASDRKGLGGFRCIRLMTL